MKKYKRIFTIVIDSLGIGAMANAAEYGDAGTDTLGHIDERMKEFRIPNLAKLGLADLHPMIHVEKPACPMGYYARLSEASVGKDTSLYIRSVMFSSHPGNRWRETYLHKTTGTTALIILKTIGRRMIRIKRI